MEREIAQPAWQLTTLFDRPASLAHHEGHWVLVVGRRSAAAETLDDAVRAVTPRRRGAAAERGRRP